MWKTADCNLTEFPFKGVLKMKEVTSYSKRFRNLKYDRGPCAKKSLSGKEKCKILFNPIHHIVVKGFWPSKRFCQSSLSKSAGIHPEFLPWTFRFWPPDSNPGIGTDSPSRSRKGSFP